MRIVVLNAPTKVEYNSAEGDFVDYDFEGGPYMAIGDDIYVGADGKREKGKFLKKVKGFGKKVGGAAKKVGKAIKNFVGKLKPKKGARKLKGRKGKTGKTEFVDPIPPVVSTRDEGGRDVLVRPNPDGTRTVLKSTEVAKGPDGRVYAKDDLSKKGQTVVENGQLMKVVEEADVAPLTTTDGEQIVFRKEDLIDKETGAPAAGMNPYLKWSLIGGGILAVAIITYVAIKNSKNK